MSLSRLSRDIITILKPSGEILEEIKADVQPKIIFIHDEKLPLEEGDKIFHKLPNGLIESFLVIDRGYYSGIGGREGHYEVKVKKESVISEEKYKSTTNVYHASGSNSRIVINSTDNSKNYYSDTDLLFNEIRLVLDGIIEEKTKEKSLQLLEELNRSKHTPSYSQNYKDFISLMANHITLIAPFIPALFQLI